MDDGTPGPVAGIRDFLDRMGPAYERRPIIGATERSVAADFYGSPDDLGAGFVADLLP